MSVTLPRASYSNSAPLLIVLSGPSGVGKDAAMDALRTLDRPWRFVVTATTRPMRTGEHDGSDYHFMGPDEFQSLRAKDGFLECAEVYGNWYGVPKQQIRDALHRGEDVILKVDIQGASTIRKLVSDSVQIFMAPANMEELRERLEIRATETGVDLDRRVRTAWQEMEHLYEFDYQVINKDGCLEEAVSSIDAIISAEKCRVVPRCINL